jgi:hypothetical protein
MRASKLPAEVAVTNQKDGFAKQFLLQRSEMRRNQGPIEFVRCIISLKKLTQIFAITTIIIAFEWQAIIWCAATFIGRDSIR